jgi:hypothetical protein
MIAVICQSEANRALIRAALPAGLPIYYVSDVRWDRIEQLPDVLVVYPNNAVHAESLAFRLESIPALHRPPLTVLVCDGSPTSFALAIASGAEAVVTDSELETCLWREITRVRSKRVLRDLEQATLLAAHFQRRLGNALTIAFHAYPPIRSVKELAREAGCHRTTLSKEWRTAATRNRRLHLRLEDLLSSVLLVWALVLHRPDRPWAWVAGCLGVHPQTLRRTMKRLAGVDLSTSRTE